MGNLTDRASIQFEVSVGFHFGKDSKSPPTHTISLIYDTPADRDAYWLVKHCNKEAPVLHLPGLPADAAADVFLKELQHESNDFVQDEAGARTIEYTVWKGVEFWKAENTWKRVHRSLGDAIYAQMCQDIQKMCTDHAGEEAKDLLNLIAAKKQPLPQTRSRSKSPNKKKPTTRRNSSRSRSRSRSEEVQSD